MRSFLGFKTIFKVKGHFQRHLAQQSGRQNGSHFSGYNCNISTTGNYRYKFDTKTCTVIFREFRESKTQIIVCATSFTLARGPQRIPARLHLQLPLHATKHPQCTSSMHPQLASGRSVQYGVHVLVFHSQPHSLAFGMLVTLQSDCFQMKAATSSARFVWWNKACWVAEMHSSALRP